METDVFPALTCGFVADSLPCYLKRLEPVTKPHVSLGTMYFAFDYQKSLESAGIVVAELNCEIKMDETPLCNGDPN